MVTKEIIQQIKALPYISKAVFAGVFNKNSNTLRNSLAYWKKTGSLIQVKRGVFVFKDYLDKKDNSLYYSRFIASKMIEPSYLSKEFVLQEYGILTDVVFGYSVVTTKKTQTITNQFGVFNYQSIKPELFRGFVAQSYGNTTWYLATKAKALFDYLYYNKQKFPELVSSEVEFLRLNLAVMKRADWLEFLAYAKLADTKTKAICNLIKTYADR